MKKFDIHICMVSHQVDANLIPILNKETRPQNVILLISDQMKERAASLESAIKPYVNVKPYSIENPTDIQSIQTLLFSIHSEIEGQSIAVNITGGTKPMSIAAYLYCSQFNLPFFYMSPQNEIQLFEPNGEAGQAQIDKTSITLNLNEKLFENYALAHGYSISTNDDMRGLAKADVEEFFTRALTGSSIENAVSCLNALAQNAKNNQLQAEVDLLNPNYQGLNLLLDIPMRANWVKYNKSEKKLTFANEVCRDFLNGKWFEIYLEGVLKEAIPQATIYRSLEISTEKNKVKNEIDIATFYQNKIFVIEAKTINFEKGDNNLQEILHKVKNITSDFGGANAQAAVISYRKATPSFLKRADEERIFIIHGDATRLHSRSQLIGKLKQWMKS